jgi:presenilin-like A22 family membrane protease
MRALKLRAELVYLAPILASLIFGVFCTFLVLTSSMEIFAVTPFPENAAGSLGNATYFVILVGTGAALFYLLLKWRSHRLINAITGLAITLAIFMLSTIYAFSALSRFNIPYVEVLILTLASLITVLADLAIFRSHSRVSEVIILCLGGALGAFLGVSIATLSTVLILAALAIYDAFAVYYGLLGKIARDGLDQFRGLSFSFRDIQMGLGDLTFYSMLSGHMLLYFGLIPCLASMLGILLGCFLAFQMLKKREVFPGLPFPIFFGLILGFVAFLIPFLK